MRADVSLIEYYPTIKELPEGERPRERLEHYGSAALSSVEIEAFRERIREAAARLFASAGYAAVTMRAVAAEVGCSAMTPYRYFASKEHIFAVVRAEAFRRFRGAKSGEEGSR